MTAGAFGFAGLTAAAASPLEAWEEMQSRLARPELSAALAAMRATGPGRAELEAAGRQWLAQGLLAPWEPAIAAVPLDEAVPPGTLPDEIAMPEGTTANRCAACGEIRLRYPDSPYDEWKHHFDHCTYPEVAPERRGLPLTAYPR